jgi:hygromycin-B 7''-O-kinase
LRLAAGETWLELRARSEVWLPLAAEALDRQGFRLDRGAFLGPGGSYPAVISGEIVVKFFGFAGEWAATWENERAAQERLSLDERILAPKLLGTGELFPGNDDSLPYMILSRIPGASWCDVPLAFDERLRVAGELGEQLRLVHALPNHDLPTIDTWQIGTVGEGARSGQFPRELGRQVDAWLETVPAAPSVFVHSDIFVRHPFVRDGRLTGIIDWGDAMSADPHVELGKIHLDVFEGDKRLLRALLDGYGWLVDADFPRRSLAMALQRHAQIHGQHGPGGDVFYRVPELIAGKKIGTLDDLAYGLFGI